MSVRQDLQVREGETFSFAFIHKDEAGAAVDLTGWTARMGIAAGRYDPLSSWITSEGTISGQIGLASTGAVTITMTGAQTDALAGELEFFFSDRERTVEPIEYFAYDLELIDTDGVVTRVLQGRLQYERGVTSGAVR